MKRYEYKIFNMSECSEIDPKTGLYKQKVVNGKIITLVDVLNGHGAEGWEVLFPITSSLNSYLMRREII